MESLDLNWIRAQFPALTQTINGKPGIFFDGPGGTQVPGSVLDAMSNYLVNSNSNVHGSFITSERTDRLINAARGAIADFLGCDRDEVVFGANMTTLTYTLSRAIGQQLQAGDEIIVTRLDHSANVSPWFALAERGVIIRVVDINIADCTLDLSDLQRQINDRTRLVAVSYASNAVGTVNDIAQIVSFAHAVNALVFVDAVHYAPHASINVHALDCDFLACSAYKFFGPHVGVLYGKKKHLNQFTPFKVRPATNEVPSCWETGTLNHEGLAGVLAAINYLAKLGCHVSPAIDNELLSSLMEADKECLTTFHCPSVLTSSAQHYHSRRAALLAAMSAIQQYERELSRYLISGLQEIPGLTIYGITESERFAWRTPTVSLRMENKSPATIAKMLGDRGIFSWYGNFYAIDLTEKLGVETRGGLLRVGLVHYNTLTEIDQFLSVLVEIAVSNQ